MAYCRSCGTEAEPGDAFCGACGVSLAPSAGDAPEPQTPEARAEPEPPAAETPARREQPPAAAPPAAPPPQAPSPAPPDREGPNRRMLALIAAGVAVAVVAWVLVSISGDDEAAASEVLLQAVGATAPDLDGDGAEDTFTPPLDPAPDDEPEVITAVPEITATVRGQTTELYGGSGEVSTCSVDQLISFLQENPAKAGAFASVMGISVDDVPFFVRGLVPVVTNVDIRVTNHGFAGGRATPFQAVLEAGTALLVDELGVPRVRCKCGNPLLPPVAVKNPEYTGARWGGFDPVHAIAPPKPRSKTTPGGRHGVYAAESFVLVGTRTELGALDVCDLVPGSECGQPIGDAGLSLLLGPFGSATEATAAFCSSLVPESVRASASGGTAATLSVGGREYNISRAPTCPGITPTPSPTPTPEPSPTKPPRKVDLTRTATAVASTEFSAQYPARLGVDGDPTTSWFSAGPGAEGTSTYTITLAQPSTVTRVDFIGNENHADPAVRSGFGFRDWAIKLLDAKGKTLTTVKAPPGGGTQSPQRADLKRMVDGVVQAQFVGRGHEDPTCGGFAELKITGYRTR